MFIHCIVKPVYDSWDRDAGNNAIINLEVIDYIKVQDDCIYAYTKDGGRYLISYYASRESSDGSTALKMLKQAINESWPIYCGILETDEEAEERWKKRDEEGMKEPITESGE
jgi:hypothetical protein